MVCLSDDDLTPLHMSGESPASDGTVTTSALLQCQERLEQKFEEMLQRQQAILLEAIRQVPLEAAGLRRRGLAVRRPSECSADTTTSSEFTEVRVPRPSACSVPEDGPMSPKTSSLQRVQESMGMKPWHKWRFKKQRASTVAIQPFEDKERHVRAASAEHLWNSEHKAPGWKAGTVGGSCLRGAAFSVIHQRYFEHICVSVIVANSVTIGAQADWAVKHSFDEVPMIFAVLDLTFSMLFFLELLVRFTAEGAVFLSRNNKSFGWNCFDCLVVLTALVDQLMQTWTSTPGVLAMRLMRLIRIARVLRVIRVFRFFQDLRVMLAGIMASVRSLAWALLLSGILAFIVGVCIMDFVAEELRRPNVDATLKEQLLAYYSSLLHTLFCMYQAVTNGLDWRDMTDPLITIQPLLGVLFSAYIAIAVLCVLNVITGLFVENAKRLSQQDETQFIMETVQTRKIWLEEVKSLFARVADPMTMQLDVQSFVEHVGDMRVQVTFKKLGIEVEQDNAAGLFELLDLRGDGFVDLDEFALGVQMLHGSARSIDMARLRYLMGNLEKQVTGLVESVRKLPSSGKSKHANLEDVWSATHKAVAQLPGTISVEEV